ncbi:GNAT family N-acetyltransferase [uncultured Enterococcus sp.]|uniref:GNAT family N-acetyltransferase n=1 Tax=uncultured Enterococcus sp. TaxID=167972 RepID=UPI002AA909F3|nr:GNAT family N-acetyltransferase [uncultured Enterococcus sp.]
MEIRRYQAGTDYEAVLSLSERLADFKLPKRTSKETLGKQQKNWLAEDLKQQAENGNSHWWVLADENEAIGGFLEITVETDWLTDEKQAYLSRICLGKESEGLGYGKKLMDYAEEWARKQGYSGISLMVIATNQHAVSFYQRLGYEVETMKLRKQLK